MDVALMLHGGCVGEERKQMICATQWKKDGEIRGRRVDL